NGSTKHEAREADLDSSDTSATKETKDDDGDDRKKRSDIVLPKGNRFRTKRGLIGILAGGLPAFLLMAKNGQNAWGVPLGFLFIVVWPCGGMELIGTFAAPAERV